MKRGRVRGIAGHTSEDLSQGWELACCPPDSVSRPDELTEGMGWRPALVPSTAAASLRAAGLWSWDSPARRFDADDWWYRTRFSAPAKESDTQLWLCFDGLATVADVWLNGTLLFNSQSMFAAPEHRVDGVLRPDNDLVLRFRSLDTLLKARRPRPRWRVPMIEHQQLRWFRTTLLGRTPGWSPPAAAVGPWRPIRLERRRGINVDDLRLSADSNGRLDVSCVVSVISGPPVSNIQIILEREGRTHAFPLGAVNVPDVERWFPHTHGVPALYAAKLRIAQGANVVDADLGNVGFRSVELDTGNGDFAVRVNGVAVFCRGACWVPPDPVSLSAEPAALDRIFDQVVAGGMNMLRLGGTMVYESDAFLDRCDARGVMLWQDFMFANMDYAEDDADFLKLVDAEVRQELARLQGRPSVTILCGNSEGEQQAAMWGAPRERWNPPLFHERIAALAKEGSPSVPYWPSSTHGGDFPHQGTAGSTSYFGVGAYLRPLDDARRAEVRFASECLAFANVPEARTFALMPDGPASKVHMAGWRTRAPRDLGAGWDFDDVRDHYLKTVFKVDPVTLRYSDHDRYLELSRVVTGEVMTAVFGEWRRKRSTTRGGLVWFLRDLWPGAGWGVIDAAGTPKAAWHYLRRALAPVALSLTDEGGSGVAVHVVNDSPRPLAGELEIVLYRLGEVEVARGKQPVTLEPHSALEVNAGAAFGEWHDLSYAHRFGPPSHNLVVARLNTVGDTASEAFYFVQGTPSRRSRDVGLTATARRRPDGEYDLTVSTKQFAQSVRVEVDGYDASDNYFHLAPASERLVVLTANAGAGAPHGVVRALNAEATAVITKPEGAR